MTDYIKYILEKVSFCPKLFEKELNKGISSLKKDDIKEFTLWVKSKFKKIHPKILNRVL